MRQVGLVLNEFNILSREDQQEIDELHALSDGSDARVPVELDQQSVGRLSRMDAAAAIHGSGPRGTAQDPADHSGSGIALAGCG